MTEEVPQTFDHAAQPPAADPPLAIEGEALDPGLVGSHYDLVRWLGKGALSEVWEAKHPNGLRVAIKILLNPSSHEKTEGQLQALQIITSLQHPFLLRTYSYGISDNRLCLVMELAEGNLCSRLEACQRTGMQGIPGTELLLYAREVAEALEYLHNKQLLHGNVKPQSILLLQGHVRVGDFGLHSDDRNAGMAGTPAYQAPETWSGQMTPASDQYSFAATYAHLRLGRPAFQGRNLQEIFFAHLEMAPDLASLPEAEREVLLKAMDKAPGQRFSSCKRLTDALAQALANGPFGEVVTPPQEPANSVTQKWRPPQVPTWRSPIRNEQGNPSSNFDVAAGQEGNRSHLGEQ